MYDYFEGHNVDAGRNAQGTPEIPGFSMHPPDYDWEMRIKVFNLLDEDDVAEAEKIYTASTKSKPGKKAGISILYENGRFFDDGRFMLMLRWGEWSVPKADSPPGKEQSEVEKENAKENSDGKKSHN